MFFQVPLSGKKTEKKFISSYAFSKPHAEISVEASRFTKKCSDFFFIRRRGLSFFKKLSLCVFFSTTTQSVDGILRNEGRGEGSDGFYTFFLLG